MGAFEVEETKQILAQALNRLPEREKIVLTLYYYEGLTLGEIGGILGITESPITGPEGNKEFLIGARKS